MSTGTITRKDKAAWALWTADDPMAELALSDLLEERGEDGSLYRLAYQIRCAIASLLHKDPPFPSQRSRLPRRLRTHVACLDREPLTVVRVVFTRCLIEVSVQIDVPDRPRLVTRGYISLSRASMAKPRYIRNRCRELARMALRAARPKWLEQTPGPVG